MDRSPAQEPLHLLFVCGGNTCRSPMAAALAERASAGGVRAESAGVAACEASARPEAVDIMREEFDIDVSNHRPRDIEDLSLGEFHYIVAMDATVACKLAECFDVPAGKMIRWNIDDPYGQGRAAYQRCVREIVRCLPDLANHLHLPVARLDYDAR
jgi:protein-tyrosine-phosphatase